ERGYDAIVHGVGDHAPSATAAIEAGYARGETDEFLVPTVIDGVDGLVRDRDSIVHINFRADRARQLTAAFNAGDDFAFFDRGPRPKLATFASMSQYDAKMPVPVALPPQSFSMILGEVLSKHGVSQLRTAETEKYAHVTYFFNGGVEAPYPGEERLLVPSPKVATYDLQPEMSALGVTDALVEAIGSGSFDFIVANFANPDMVGHTGVWDATIDALATIDTCLTRIVTAIDAVDADDPGAPGALLAITADHGNADAMRDAEGDPVTAHSLNPVPFVLVGRAARGLRLADGVLADVAPTLLEFAGLPRWEGMTGRSRLL
ncbi:MAG: 2,3-bisphosphoglycerate-independent phosphoglycerate mutase, partial [Chloroflexota bacterium]